MILFASKSYNLSHHFTPLLLPHHLFNNSHSTLALIPFSLYVCVWQHVFCTNLRECLSKLQNRKLVILQSEKKLLWHKKKTISTQLNYFRIKTVQTFVIWLDICFIILFQKSIVFIWHIMDVYTYIYIFLNTVV